MAGLQKNVASQHIKFIMVSATTGGADASATVTAYVTKDGGVQASGSGTVTNLGNGQYDYAPTQSETNATDIGFLFTATGDIPIGYDFHTDIVDANGYPSINLVDIAGSAISTSSAQLGVNAVNINGVSASSVTTINANIGTAQPINFTGTSTSALVKSDMVDIAGSAVSTSSAQLGVNVVSVAGAASNIKKNQALSGFSFLMTDSTSHNPATGLTVAGTVSHDGGVFGSLTNAVSEIANGWYTVNLAAADLNGNNIALRFTATGADDRDILIVTQP